MSKTNEEIESDVSARAIGYGDAGLRPGKRRHVRILRSTIQPTIDQSTCEETCKKRKCFHLGPETMCAGYESSEILRMPCDGDSGGPLVIQGRLAGIISWGTGRELPKHRTSAFTRVSFYYDLIKNNTNVDAADNTDNSHQLSS